MHLDFYANYRDDSESPSSPDNFNLANNCTILSEQSFSSTEESTVVHTAIIQKHQHLKKSELNDHMQTYKEKLDTIIDDMLMICQSEDGNFIGGGA